MKKIDEDMVIAEDALITEVQFAIHNLLEAKGMSRADLARALGVSEARVSQLFSENSRNLTLKTIARIFFVLDEEPQITSPTLHKMIPVRGMSADCLTKTPRSDVKVGKVTLMMARLDQEVRARNLFELEANDNAHEEYCVAA
jgi:transcriptional regulator with XRE-family HTH domain